MTLLLIACVIVATAVRGRGILTVSAESDAVQYRYEQTNVMTDLRESTFGGKAFDITDYPHNEHGKPQVISFVEFCYSYYADKQSDYGLYAYVYNPQDRAMDAGTARNKIQLTYGDKPSYAKYTLKQLSYSKDAGIEGRFYKYKVIFTASERADILKTVKPDARVYSISGIELSVKNEVTEYTCAQVYKYKGFAVGYGSELAESDTLSCSVDGFDKYLSLDVRSTYWRPPGTTEDLKSRDTLHSVYFAVPNRIIQDYGEMTGVHATWLNAKTAPIIVTGNKTVYNAMELYIGKHQDAGNSEDYPENKTLNYAVVTDSERSLIYGHGHYGTTAYNVWTVSHEGSTMSYYDRIIFDLRYLFYAENGNADTYTLPAEALIGDKDKNVKGWFEKYTEKYGGELVNARYSKDLFDEVDDEFTEVNITANDEFKLTDVTTKENWWSWLFPHLKPDIIGETTYNVSAIQEVGINDIDNASSKTAFCNEFYVDENDYDELNRYVANSAAKNETVYLFRYYQSKYECQEAREFEFVKDWTIARGTFGNYQELDTNAYIAQMQVQLDFDIIDLTFIKDNVVTKIPVIMSPMDIVADADHPVYTTDDNGLTWWQILLAVLLGILVLFLLLKFLPTVFVPLGKLLVVPFKAMGAVGKSIGDEVKPLHERTKQRRKERKEQKRMEREQRRNTAHARKEEERKDKFDRKRKDKERKVAEKQLLRDEKQKQDRERKSKRIWKLRDKERKRIKQHRKESEKIMEKQYKEMQRQKSKGEKIANKKSGRLTDDELAAIYYSEFLDKFGEAFPDDDPFDY